MNDLPKSKPGYFEHRERMRVRYDQNGFDGFLDYEILEFILFYSIPRKDTREEAKSLLKEFGSLSGVFGADFYTLQKCKGIGAASARLLKLFPDRCV